MKPKKKAKKTAKPVATEIRLGSMLKNVAKKSKDKDPYGKKTVHLGGQVGEEVKPYTSYHNRGMGEVAEEKPKLKVSSYIIGKGMAGRDKKGVRVIGEKPKTKTKTKTKPKY